MLTSFTVEATGPYALTILVQFVHLFHVHFRQMPVTFTAIYIVFCHNNVNVCYEHP